MVWLLDVPELAKVLVTLEILSDDSCVTTKDVSALDDYSRPIAKAVFRRWPDWRTLGKILRRRSKSYFVLEVPPANPNARCGVKLTVGEGATALEFENDHLHVDDYLDVRPTVSGLVVEFIEQYLNEELVSVSWWQKGELRVSTLQGPRENIRKHDSLKGEVTCRVRSWSGKFDRDFIQK